MSHLFKIIAPNFFTLLSSPNKDIYIDCLLILDNLINKENDLNIDKKIALNHLEQYFMICQNPTLVADAETTSLTEGITNHRQKANKIISIFKNSGWLGEERIKYDTINLNFFDYSLEMIRFLKKTLNQIRPESIGDIYSIYSLLNTFIIEKNYATFKEIHTKSERLILTLQILKANVYRFYHQLLNTQFSQNMQQILEQLLLDYKKNFFDSSYYLLKTTDNFFKYRRKINLFLNKIQTDTLYTAFLQEQLQKMYSLSANEAHNQIEEQISQIKNNLHLTDQLIQIIDKKNEEYLRIVCERILFFNDKARNIHNLLNFILKLILNNDISYERFFNLYNIKNLDRFSLFKPRRTKQEIIIEPLSLLTKETKTNLQNKKNAFLQKDYFFHKTKIFTWISQLLEKKNPLPASEIINQAQQQIAHLIFIYLYAHNSKENKTYRIESLNEKITYKKITFSNFIIYKIN